MREKGEDFETMSSIEGFQSAVFSIITLCFLFSFSSPAPNPGTEAQNIPNSEAQGKLPSSLQEA